MSNQFIKLFQNKNVPFDVKALAKLLDASYTNGVDESEFIKKESFAPSTLFYGHGACPRYWFLAFNGEHFVKKYDPFSIDNMQSGTDAHRRIQENFSNSGIEVECETELRNEDPPIRCFVDGLAKYSFNGKNIVVEIKTTRAEAFIHLVANNKPREYQEMQLLLYMYLMGEQYGAMLYENKNDHRKIIFPVEMTHANKAKIEKVFEWMRMVYKNYQNETLPKKPYRSNSKICKSCPIQESCFTKGDGILEIETLKYTEEENDPS